MQKQKAVRMTSSLLPNPNQPPTKHTIKNEKTIRHFWGPSHMRFHFDGFWRSLAPLFSWDAYEVWNFQGYINLPFKETSRVIITDFLFPCTAIQLMYLPCSLYLRVQKDAVLHFPPIYCGSLLFGNRLNYIYYSLPKANILASLNLWYVRFSWIIFLPPSSFW